MNLKIGDYVRFINERQEGIVTRIIDHQLVGVTTSDDFEIPVAANELVKVNRAEDQLRDEESSAPFVSSSEPDSLIEEGLFIAFIPNEEDKNLDMRLINSEEYQVLYSCSTEKNNHTTGIVSGILATGDSAFITELQSNHIGNWPAFLFQFIFHKKGEFDLKKAEAIHMDFKPSEFQKGLEAIPGGKQKGYLFKVKDKHELPKLTNIPKEALEKINPSKAPAFIPPIEVDLHIEALTISFPTMSNSEMLSMQMRHFERCLDAAIEQRFQKIIFIHGVGAGTLRYEIHKKISKHPYVKTYKDAQRDKFGYGATEVILR